MMQPAHSWIEQTRVKAYQTDFRAAWKPHCFFQAMQEAATHHAASLGFGYEKMLARGMIWVLSRIKICFNRFPGLAQEVTIKTWPKGVQQKIFFMRDFEISDSHGRLAVATSAWLLINPELRRMLLPQSVYAAVPDNGGFSILDETLEKLTSPAVVLHERHVTADFSSIDLMGHVNNTRYVEWVSDCFPFEMYQQFKLSWMQINYLNEITPGQTVLIKVGKRSEDSIVWLVEGQNQLTGVRSFEAEVGWEANHSPV